jgi:hypothetical protein
MILARSVRHPGSNPGWYLIHFPGEVYSSALVVDGSVATTRTHSWVHAFMCARELHPFSPFKIDNGCLVVSTDDYPQACSQYALQNLLRHPGSNPPDPTCIIHPIEGRREHASD